MEQNVALILILIEVVALIVIAWLFVYKKIRHYVVFILILVEIAVLLTFVWLFAYKKIEQYVVLILILVQVAVLLAFAWQCFFDRYGTPQEVIIEKFKDSKEQICDIESLKKESITEMPRVCEREIQL